MSEKRIRHKENKNNIKNTKKENRIIVPKRIDLIKIVHLAIIILGTIFVSISCFHASLWFDESYSVAIAGHSFAEIWKIGSSDVHPVLYYWMIHIIEILTHNNIICIRLFSCVPLVILSIMGYINIRKDFGEKIGLLFSFLSLFMPVCLVYSGEIRMYTWAMLFVFIMATYAYKILKLQTSKKEWIIFSAFSLASAYTHYYGLITAFVINIILLIYFAIKSFKNRKNVSKYGKYITNFKYNFLSDIIQALLYIPWLGTVISQAKAVSGSFWINDPKFLQILEFQFTGNLPKMETKIQEIIAWPFIIIMMVYLVYLLIKNWKKAKPIALAMTVYLAVVGIILFVSKVLNRPILYPRYFLNITGLFLFTMAFLIGNDNNWIRIIASMLIIVGVSTVANVKLCKTNYNYTNAQPLEYIESKIQPDDILIVDNNGSGFVIIAQLKAYSNKAYFWDRKDWHVDAAYKAYGDTITTMDSLKDYKGRIWALSAGDYNFANAIKEEYDNAKIIDEEQYKVAYEKYEYAISLIEVD